MANLVAVILQACCLVTVAAVRRFPLIQAPAAPPPGLFLFGDSSLDVGNDIYLRSSGAAGHPPYGRDFFHRPTGRFSNGRNTADFIAQRLGIPYPLPFLNPGYNVSVGVNFATSGSGILDRTGDATRVYSLSYQVDQFRMLRRSMQNDEFRHHVTRSLFVLSAGANDIVDCLEGSSLTRPFCIDSMVSGLNSALQVLYENGARKFLLYGTGPVGCFPSVLAKRAFPGVSIESTCSKLANDLAMEFNEAMEQKVKKLTSINPGMNIVLTKIYSLISSIITGGSSVYGFEHGAVACCGGGRYNAQAGCGINDPRYVLHVCSDASSYFFWDSVHLTEAASELLVRLAWDGPPPLAAPFNVSTLLSIAPPLF